MGELETVVSSEGFNRCAFLWRHNSFAEYICWQNSQGVLSSDDSFIPFLGIRTQMSRPLFKSGREFQMIVPLCLNSLSRLVTNSSSASFSIISKTSGSDSCDRRRCLGSLVWSSKQKGQHLWFDGTHLVCDFFLPSSSSRFLLIKRFSIL